LPALLEQLDLDRTMPEVELCLWGNRILMTPSSKGFWDHLSRAREALEGGSVVPPSQTSSCAFRVAFSS
jgi:hypothetical protein